MTQQEKRGFNTQDAMEYLGGISRNGLQQLIKDKVLRSYRIGSRRYFLREELDAFIERQIEKVSL